MNETCAPLQRLLAMFWSNFILCTRHWSRSLNNANTLQLWNTIQHMKKHTCNNLIMFSLYCRRGYMPTNIFFFCINKCLLLIFYIRNLLVFNIHTCVLSTCTTDVYSTFISISVTSNFMTLPCTSSHIVPLLSLHKPTRIFWWINALCKINIQFHISMSSVITTNVKTYPKTYNIVVGF